jgi:tRNA-specific 2-thiouridylase
VPDGDYARVVESLRPEAAGRAGTFVDAGGRELGRHRGVHRYTVGQRRGLGLAAERRLYVTAIDAASGRVRVGPADELLASGAWLERVSWVAGDAPAGLVRVEARVRHRHAGAKAGVQCFPGGCARLAFDAPVAAVTPGQPAVFYAGDEVLGGGWIAGALA